MQATSFFLPLRPSPTSPTMPLLEGLVNGGEGGLPALLLDNLFATVPVLLTLAVLFFLRPRKAGSKYKDAPPMVTKSTVSSVPLLGPAIEFGKSPVKMVKRCYDDYGPVFTVPVRGRVLQICVMCGAVGSRRRCICFVLLLCAWSRGALLLPYEPTNVDLLSRLDLRASDGIDIFECHVCLVSSACHDMCIFSHHLLLFPRSVLWLELERLRMCASLISISMSIYNTTATDNDLCCEFE